MCWYSPILQSRISPAKSDPSSTENTFGMPFKKRKLADAHQCSERKRQDLAIFDTMTGEFYVGKRQGGLPCATRHWSWSPSREVNVQSHHIASKPLFSGIFMIAILPCLYELTMWCFHRMCTQGVVMLNLLSLEWRTILKCLSCNGKSLHQTRAPRPRGTYLVSVPQV